MINRRIVLGSLVSVSALTGSGALAQKGKAKKPKKHVNGSQLLGEKIKQNGKHKIGKAGKSDVEIEVRGGKVAALTAGGASVKKVKSKQKLAAVTPSVILVSATSENMQLAQASDWYYGYWIDEVDYDYYYWFAADEVYVDGSWPEYSDY